MKRTALTLLLGLLSLGSIGCSGLGQPTRMTVIDLTHAYDENTIYWPTAEGFSLTVDSKGVTPGGYWYEANSFSTAEHGGTHLDAPVHFAEGMPSVDQIPLQQLIGPGVMIDVRNSCERDRDHLVSVDELMSWESRYGRIPAGAIVLLNTGFGRFWPDRVRYMGTAERGPEGVAALHFPGLHPKAARWLVDERTIGAIGLDTPSIDHGPSQTFEAHRILFKAGIPALENVAALERLPAIGFRVMALPMKIAGGSGGPVRIAAFVPGG